MSTEKETWYAVRRADGKYLVVVKTPLGARLAMWIDNIELATQWPFMTGATLEMGLDLDPALQAERGGWDVVPVQRREAPATIVQFAIAIPALLLCLLCSSFASAQTPAPVYSPWVNACVAHYPPVGEESPAAAIRYCLAAEPKARRFVATPAIVTLIGLRATDASLTWDLAHRYGGHEMNPFMPQNPKVIVGLLAAETAGQVWALAKVSAQHPRVARILTWASIGMESWVVWHNAQQYQGR